MTLTLLHPRALPSFPALPDHARWLYADDDPQVDEQLSQRFGNDRRLVSPAAFQARAASLRAPFMQWLDRCLEHQPAENWIPASYFKDIFTAPVFLHLVCLTLLKDALATQQPVILISSSDVFAQQVEDLATRHENQLTQIGSADFAKDARSIRWRAARHLLLYPLRLVAGIVFARSILGEAHRQRLQATEILVDSFLLEGDLDSSGNFRDRFLPGLLDYYQTQGIAAASVACTETLPLAQLSSTYKAMRRSKTSFAPSELFLRIRDILDGQRRAWRTAQHSPRFAEHLFENISVTHIATFWWKIAACRTVGARCLTNLGKRMAEHGLTPRYFLDWYENQAIDKAMHIAFTQTGDRTRTIAVRQYFPAENVVSFFSTSGEVAHGASPTINWVCGRRTAELFARHDNLGSYRVVPALRYASLYDAEPSSTEGEDLVIFLTSSLEESLSILQIAFANLDQNLANFRSIRIKSHQALHADIAALANERWTAIPDKSVTWESESSSALLPSAALVLTAGSSVAVEALCRGIPVVLTGRTAGLDVNPLEDVEPTNWRIVYTPAEFTTLLSQWLPTLPPLSERQTAGLRIRSEYFEPVTTESMQAFLPV